MMPTISASATVQHPRRVLRDMASSRAFAAEISKRTPPDIEAKKAGAPEQPCKRSSQWPDPAGCWQTAQTLEGRWCDLWSAAILCAVDIAMESRLVRNKMLDLIAKFS